ncbi:MAG: GGDEF domain-containing protein [Lachnospiraceae bacterium]|nr:GGDEF domain-containing protein [Lachnospiraceae bacterium]
MDESFFRKIIDTAQDCVFWKDADRRFLGANKAFLDYYGFESEDMIIGKNDEDMGWHSDPEPFKQDELRVLAGESTYKVHGTCEVRGQERNIIASKSPIYENGEVVGMVGSFMDVTDVVNKKSISESSQQVYSEEGLRHFKFFDKILDESTIGDILDPLTGVVSRAYALEYAKWLIDSDIPFTFAIVDLDNFKFINDSYGHRIGDKVLMDVSANMVRYVGERGIVGRFGGDELLIVNLVDLSYDEKKIFYEGMYSLKTVFRINYDMEECSPFITGTIGSATYPSDSDNYDELFELIDKTLYRGKNKGRNCYIIYVEEKHKNLEIKKLAKRGIYTCMNEIITRFETAEGIVNKLCAALPVLEEEYNMQTLYLIDSEGIMHDAMDRRVNVDVGTLELPTDEDLFIYHSVTDIAGISSKLYEALSEHEVRSSILVRVGILPETYGYIICTEERNERIWQEDECAIVFFLAKLIAGIVKLERSGS